jgi:hypothetical protein
VNVQEQTVARVLRKVPMPVEYTTACKALAACLTIDEAKHFSDKADALAAWAKIYRSREAHIQARRLKLHAYRRIGELAIELRPQTTGRADMGKGRILAPRRPGPMSLLIETGFTYSEAHTMRRVANMPAGAFENEINRPTPPTPSMMVNQFRKDATDQYLKFVRGRVPGALYFCRANSAKDLASGFSIDEALLVRGQVREIADWLDEFEQHLPKGVVSRSP